MQVRKKQHAALPVYCRCLNTYIHVTCKYSGTHESHNRPPPSFLLSSLLLPLPSSPPSFRPLCFSTNLLHSSRVIEQVSITRRLITHAIAQQYFGCYLLPQLWYMFICAFIYGSLLYIHVCSDYVIPWTLIPYVGFIISQE